jgi:CheY-like chemotaxis protein
MPIRQAATRKSPAKRIDGVSGSNNTVLLIEDEQITSTSLQTALQIKGYRVLNARGGAQGIEIALRDLPDLIVLDLMMPDINGFDVASRLSAEKTVADVPILVLTAMDLSESERSRLDGKIWRIAEKGSLSTHEFITLVEQALSP